MSDEKVIDVENEIEETDELEETEKIEIESKNLEFYEKYPIC